MSKSTAQSVLFPHLISKPVLAAFDQDHSSSDGGALLLKAVDDQLGLSERLAACLRDEREPGKVHHGFDEILRQRLYAIALGYPDCNDAQVLAHDPIHKMLAGRAPISGDRLASQSTLSRFENAVGPCAQYRVADASADTVLGVHRRRLGKRAKTVILDFDPTDDPTYGQQEFTFYHGHYRTHCYLPLIGTIAFNNEKRQSLLCAVLRPGNAGAHLGLIPILDRLLEKVRAAFPKARIRIRLDGGFCSPHVLDYLDHADVEYVVGLANWPALKKRAEKARREAVRAYEKTGKTTQVFGETRFQTKTTWPHPRRVIFKAEVVDYPGREPRQNLRFVVTNMKMTPKRLYRFYCQRGAPENRIKELKHGLELGRTSCSSFLANQFRVQLTAAAYVLMQELARRARHTAYRDAQVTRLRDRLLKLPAWVEESVRRVVVHLPTSFLGKAEWQKIATAVGGASP
ncbi:MAG: IS1380 family transposase [Gammaproteobacteria bacterium]|nr:MAG: IS1380 family transposase [Gammaproteobacteria bacterium]